MKAGKVNGTRAACFDVYYYGDVARACAIVFEITPVEKIIAQYAVRVGPVDAYTSGEFYKRELPCLRAVYERIREDLRLIIVDGFVWLDHGKKGLGGHLFEALSGKIPVVGVAKTLFKGCTDYQAVYRGKSRRPLFVSSIGLDGEYAAALIKNLRGASRIPEVLKKVDQLTRLCKTQIEKSV